jgi:hypothetical protein
MKCINSVNWGKQYLSDLLDHAKSRNESSSKLLDGTEERNLSNSY